MKQKRIKIRLYGVHLFYVRNKFLERFKKYCNVSDFSEWLKNIVYNDLGIELNSVDKIKEVESVIEDKFYDNFGEWARERMRMAIISSEKYKNEINYLV